MMIKMECLLLLWIKDCNKKKTRSTGECSGQSIKVIASKGCFNHFRSWRELINVTLFGEATNTDEDSVIKFAPRFQILVTSSAYGDHQPFNDMRQGFSERQPHG